MRVLNERNNFDLLRFILASMVVVAHFHAATGVDRSAIAIIFGRAEFAVNGFFVISGLLVIDSYNRNPVFSAYIKKRARRLLPAYIVAILTVTIAFSAISKIDIEDYFRSPETTKYIIANLLFCNFLQPELPGVFQDNPLQVVNASLWTIKVEVGFYLFVPLVVWLMRFFGNEKTILIVILASCGYTVFCEEVLNSNVLARQLPGALSYFLSGHLCRQIDNKYLNRRLTKWVWYSTAASVAILSECFQNPYLTILRPIAIGSLIYWFAYRLRYLGNFGGRGDLSYGIYIFHFPIWQAFLAIGVQETIGPGPMFSIGIVCILVVAAISWHFIEKPFLKRRILQNIKQ